MRTLLAVALILCACDDDSGPKGFKVVDLSVPYGADLSHVTAGTPTCVPPVNHMAGTMTLTCPSGTTFYSSPTSSGCFPSGMMPPNPNTSPGWDENCGTTDILAQCNPGCSFCLPAGAALPPGCTLCNGNC